MIRASILSILLAGCSAWAGDPAANKGKECSAFPVPMSSGELASDLSGDPSKPPPSYFNWHVASVALPTGWTPIGGGSVGAVGGVVIACR